MGKNIAGALSYNEQKIRQGTAELILASHFARDISEMGFSEKLLRFEKLNQLNEKSKTNTLHLSLNFSPDDQLDDAKLQQIAFDYMERIGFGDQPFLVYQHTDTGHPHLHIVTTTIRPNGKAIYLHNLAKRKSEPARKAIEVEFGLVKAEGRRQTSYLGATANISNTVSRVVAEYKFSSIEELNAILRQFNIMADNGEHGSFLHQKGGLVYCRIDENGYKTGKVIKASSVYKSPTLAVLESKFEKNSVSKAFYKKKVGDKVASILAQVRSANEFLQKLKQRDIGCSIQYGRDGSITNVSFVDHFTKTVFQANDIGISVPDLLTKLNYQQHLSPSPKKSGMIYEPPDAGLSHPSAANSLFLIKTLFSSQYDQPQVSPEFFKKKRKKKKR